MKEVAGLSPVLGNAFSLLLHTYTTLITGEACYCFHVNDTGLVSMYAYVVDASDFINGIESYFRVSVNRFQILGNSEILR